MYFEQLQKIIDKYSANVEISSFHFQDDGKGYLFLPLIAKFSCLEPILLLDHS